MNQKIKEIFLINGKIKRTLLLTIICMIGAMLIPVTIETQLLKSLLRTVATGAILYYGIQLMPKRKRAIHIFFIIGTSVSIFGDVIYYWPIMGMVVGNLALLNAYLFYSIGFFTQIKAKILSFLSIVPIFYAGYFYTTRVIFYGLEKNQMAYYIYYILVHATFLILFLWASVNTRNKWILIGAALFALMDLMKSVNFFVEPFLFSSQLALLFYLLGHFFLARSMKGFKKAEI